MTPNMIFFLLITITVTLCEDDIYVSSVGICQRCKCTKSDDAQILTLDCTNQHIKGILSEWPPHNGTTIIATFAENNIPTLGTLPPTDAVVEVVLSKCKIQFLYPGLFAGAKHTKMVDLSHNRLTAEEVTLEKFMGPYHKTQMEPIALENLNLAYNQIHSLNKNVFLKLPHLKRLNLEGNDFTVLDIHTQLALSSIKPLVSLNLANNELTELVENAIESYTNLTELDLSKNLLDFVPRSLAKVGKTLEILKIDDNPIIEIVAETFTGLGNLLELSANNLTKLKHINASGFAPLTKLLKLSLSHNLQLHDIDGAAFAPNQTLQEFYINDNALERINSTLLIWSSLRAFEFKDNPLHCSCDLYNITSALSPDITRNEAGPYCVDPRDGRSFQVFHLQSDICSAAKLSKPVAALRHKLRYHHFSIPLAGLIVTLIFAIFVAMFLGFTRYRKFLRNRNYPFASQVLYNPLSTINSRL